MASASTKTHDSLSDVDVASIFVEYDVNKDGKIELGELRELCARLGFPMSLEGASKVMTAIDKDKDGVVSPSELAAFLSSSAVEDVKLSGVEAFGVRAALLSQFAIRAGASLVRRVSSEAVAEPLSDNMSEFDVSYSIGEVPDGVGVSVSSSLVTSDAAEPPPAELTSGKGLVIAFEAFGDANVEGACAAINGVFMSEPPPLPPTCTLAAQPMVIHGKTCLAFVLDAPIADIPPELAMMFGIDDFTEVFRGLSSRQSFKLNKSVDDILHSEEPLLESMAVHGESHVRIPHHLMNVAKQLIAAASAMGMGGMPAPVAMQLKIILPLYALMFKFVRQYKLQLKLNDMSEVVETLELMMSGAPEPVRDQFETILHSSVASHLGNAPELAQELISSARPEARPIVESFALTAKALHSVQIYVGPLALRMDFDGLEIPYLREAASH